MRRSPTQLELQHLLPNHKQLLRLSALWPLILFLLP
ncbi:hypothetical protein [Caudoviricetes sp.]|nr:hypothetical protein [Caudoviricetes sp.]